MLYLAGLAKTEQERMRMESMLSLELIEELYRHMEWADAEVWRALLQRVNNGGDDSLLLDRLYHTHATQRVFLQLWRGESVDRYNPSRFSSATEMYPWIRSWYPEVNLFLKSLHPDELERSLVVPWSRLFESQLGREPAPTTFGETMFQVSSHTTYHRGQINTRLREIGGEPPLVDYIAWLWRERPAPGWKEV